MKRCPQCEFIYEDDQSLCDMDGALLVFDSRTLPNLHALAPVDVPIAPKAHWRHRTFPAMAALILATVLSLVYFVSTQRSAPVSMPMPGSGASAIAPSNTSAAPASDANQAMPPAPAAPEVDSAAVAIKDETPPAKDESKSQPARTNSAPAAATTSSAAAKKAPVKVQTTQSKPEEEPKKDDSKVGSILKKTGHLLKKPFKL